MTQVQASEIQVGDIVSAWMPGDKAARVVRVQARLGGIEVTVEAVDRRHRIPTHRRWKPTHLVAVERSPA